MDKRIAPDLFARLMRMSSPTRTDLLEYFGQTTVSAVDAARLIDQAANRPSTDWPRDEAR